MSELAVGGQQSVPTDVDHRPLSQLAIVALVTAFAVPPVGLVLAVASFVRFRGGGYRGRGLAVTAVVAAVTLGVALVVAAIALRHTGVVILGHGSGSGSFGWYAYSPLGKS